MVWQRLVIDDCLEYHKTMPSEYVDLVVTDPPYNISGGGRVQKRRGVIRNAHYGEWDVMGDDEYDGFIRQILTDYEDILVSGGSGYMFLDKAFVGVAWRIAEEVGLVPKNIIACVKRNPVPGILGRRNWRSGYETALYFTKGKANTFNFVGQKQMINVLYYTIGKHDTAHPTEKPLDIIRHFLNVSSVEGDLVLDSFAGSGVVMEACRKENRRCIGIEIDPIWEEVIQEKALLKQSSLQDRFWLPDDDANNSQMRLDVGREPIDTIDDGAGDDTVDVVDEDDTRNLSLNEFLWRTRFQDKEI